MPKANYPALIRGKVVTESPRKAGESNTSSIESVSQPKTETAPAGNRGLTQTPVLEVRAMANAIAQSENHKETAALFLRLSRDSLDTAKRQRLQYVLLARKYGLTNAEIGAQLGISEAAVRSMISRNGDD